MLEFVVIFLPGVIFAWAAEHLMKRKLDTHYFLFLTAFNILASGTMDYTTSALKQALYSILSGFPLCLVEAFIGRYVFVSLDDTNKEEEEKNA